MKCSHLMFIVIGVAILFTGCSKEESIAPVSDQETSYLKAQRIPFTGESNSTGVILDPGTTTVLPNGNTKMLGQAAVWCESADVDLVAGRSIWYVNSITYPDGSAKFWGKADIFVGEDCFDPMGYDGKWRLTFQGNLDPNTGVIDVDANGVGKEGVVKGMIGKWTYTMNFANGFFYTSEGYIK